MPVRVRDPTLRHLVAYSEKKEEDEQEFLKLIQKKLSEWGWEYDLDDIETFLRAVRWAEKEIVK